MSEPEEVVRFTALFKRSATEAELQEFWKEYVDAEAVMIDEITEAEIIDTETGEHVDDVWVVHATTNEHNYIWFEQEFGAYLNIGREE